MYFMEGLIMKKKLKKSSNKVIFILFVTLLLISLTYFIILYLEKVVPIIEESKKPLLEVLNFRPDNQEMFYGNSSAPITIIAYSGFLCKECKNYYNGPFLYIKENYINTGKVRYYYLPFLTNEDISNLSLEYNISKYLYCSEQIKSEYYWQDFESFFKNNQEDSADMINNGKSRFQDCFNKEADIFIRSKQKENNFFGIVIQPTLFIGIDNTDNTILNGVPQIRNIDRAIRQKEITIGMVNQG